MNNLKPVADRVFVKPIEKPITVSIKIILPDSIKEEKMLKGEVVAYGYAKKGKKGKITPITDLQKGDVILYYKEHGTEFEYERIKYVSLFYRHLLLKLEGVNEINA